MLKIKGAVSWRLREDNSHLLSQIYNDITETMWNIIWYHIYIVKIASDHYICTFFVSKKNLRLRVKFRKFSLGARTKEKKRSAQNHLAEDRDERADGDGSNTGRSQRTG